MSPVVAISGSSGLIGSALGPALEQAGHRVRRLVRHAPASATEIQWAPSAGILDERHLADVDVIVNLAGETIGKRWTSWRRRAIRESRVLGTQTIADAIRRSGRPITLVNASAVGYYGSRGDELLDEQSTSGSGYLAAVCREWEAATQPVAESGSRVVLLRSGVVLSQKGGALPEMLRPFRLGVGGRIGSGGQWLAWIDLDDLVRAIRFVIEHSDIEGPVNTVAPNPVTNREFTTTVAEVLHRPAVVPVPSLVLELMFGEMAKETLLASQRAVPSVLMQRGFEFSRATLKESLLGAG